MSGIATAVAVGGLGGAYLASESQDKASKRAAGATRDATDQQIAFQRESRDMARGDLAPQREMFQNILPQFVEMSQQQGAQAPDLSGASLYNFDSDPMYQAMADEMGQQTMQMRAAQGGLNSSRTDDLIARNLVPLMQSSYNRNRQNALAEFDMENTLNNQQYGQMFNLANLGAAATGSSANTAMSAGSGMAGAAANQGNALSGIAMQQGANQADLYSGLGALPLNAYSAYQLGQ